MHIRIRHWQTFRIHLSSPNTSQRSHLSHHRWRQSNNCHQCTCGDLFERSEDYGGCSIREWGERIWSCKCIENWENKLIDWLLYRISMIYLLYRVDWEERKRCRMIIIYLDLWMIIWTRINGLVWFVLVRPLPLLSCSCSSQAKLTYGVGSMVARHANLKRQPITSHPTVRSELETAFDYSEESVVVSDHLVTTCVFSHHAYLLFVPRPYIRLPVL